jgi:hypothetical protein
LIFSKFSFVRPKIIMAVAFPLIQLSIGSQRK